jgi:hypothetical protein
MSERDRGRGKAPIYSQVFQMASLTFSTRATQVYIAPSPKLAVMGQLPPFLRTRERSAIQAWTIRTRIPMVINDYKMSEIQKWLASGLPLKTGQCMIHKTEPHWSFVESTRLLKFVLRTVYTSTPDSPQYKIFTEDGPHSGPGWSIVQKLKPKQNFPSSV